MEDRRLPGRSGPGVTDDALLPPVRLRLLRTVTVEGTYAWPSAEPLRGEAPGGVDVGPGNFDRADCTRCSSNCILLINPWRWYKDPEDGRPGPLALVFGRLLAVGRAYDGVRSLVIGIDGPRECPGMREDMFEGRGVVSALLIEMRDLVI